MQKVKSGTTNSTGDSTYTAACGRRERQKGSEKEMNMRYALRSEETEQVNIIEWARWQISSHPELTLLHHCPNGGSRNKAEAIKLKQMGVIAGVPDLHLPVPKGIYAGLYIELKYNKGRLESSQREFLKLAARYGNYCAVCYGAEEAIRVINEYIGLKIIDTGKRENRMKTPNLSVFKDGKAEQL